MIGKVLWWSNRDQNGVIIDSRGNEYYFDRSVITSKSLAKIENGMFVTFEFDRCENLLTAKNLIVAKSKDRQKIERKFSLEQAQLSLPLSG